MIEDKSSSAIAESASGTLLEMPLTQANISSPPARAPLYNLNRLYLKIHGCNPSDLPHNFKELLQAELNKVGKALVDTYVRSGCIELVLEVTEKQLQELGNAARSQALQGGQAGPATVLLEQALVSEQASGIQEASSSDVVGGAPSEGFAGLVSTISNPNWLQSLSDRGINAKQELVIQAGGWACMIKSGQIVRKWRVGEVVADATGLPTLRLPVLISTSPPCLVLPRVDITNTNPCPQLEAFVGQGLEEEQEASIGDDEVGSEDICSDIIPVAGIAEFCTVSRLGSNLVARVVVRGCHISGEGIQFRARSRGSFLPVAIQEVVSVGEGGVSQAELTVSEICHRGLIRLEAQYCELLSNWKPIVVVDEPAVMAELWSRVSAETSLVARGASNSGDWEGLTPAERVLVDIGLWLEQLDEAWELGVAKRNDSESANTKGQDYLKKLRHQCFSVGCGLLMYAIDSGWNVTGDYILRQVVSMMCGLEVAPTAAEFYLALSAYRAVSEYCHLNPEGLTLLHRAVRSAQSPMVVTVTRWGVRYGYPWSWQERGPAGLCPMHLAAVLNDGGKMAAQCFALSSAAKVAWTRCRAEDNRTPAEYAALLSNYSNLLAASGGIPELTAGETQLGQQTQVEIPAQYTEGRPLPLSLDAKDEATSSSGVDNIGFRYAPSSFDKTMTPSMTRVALLWSCLFGFSNPAMEQGYINYTTECVQAIMQRFFLCVALLVLMQATWVVVSEEHGGSLQVVLVCLVAFLPHVLWILPASSFKNRLIALSIVELLARTLVWWATLAQPFMGNNISLVMQQYQMDFMLLGLLSGCKRKVNVVVLWLERLWEVAFVYSCLCYIGGVTSFPMALTSRVVCVHLVGLASIMWMDYHSRRVYAMKQMVKLNKKDR